MLKSIAKKLFESFISIIPIMVIVVIIFLVQQFSNIFNGTQVLDYSVFIVFLICGAALMIGMSFFTLGSDIAMSNAGKYLGSSIAKQKSLILILIITFFLGLMITIAEPDLSVLAGYIDENDLNPWVLKLAVGAGIGFFLALGVYRICKNKNLRLWIIFCYALVFGLACFFGSEDGAILELSFDSGGATTGPITVPFLIAFGTGVAEIRSGKDSKSNSFGMTGLASVGPIVIVMLLGIVLKPNISGQTFSDNKLIELLMDTMVEVTIAILPILVFFFIYQFIMIKLPKKELLKILFGFIYMWIGLVIFLAAAGYGFIPLGRSLGENIASLGDKGNIILLVMAVLFGAVIVLAEPGVQVLTKQVEEISSGGIKRMSLLIALSVGVAIAVLLSVIRVIFAPTMSIMYYFVPLYIFALFFSLLVPDIYVAVAFDSGGVASGAMASCFVLPFILGIASSKESSITGFGVIGLIATMPVIMVQFLGIASSIRDTIHYFIARSRIKEPNDSQIIHFKEEE